MILDKIVERKKLQLAQEMRQISIEGWKRKLKESDMQPAQDFFNAIKREGELSVIAEVKKASPSRGVIREDFNPLEIAREYYNSRVQAISVLTEREYFQGCDDYLVKIRQSVPLPLLRKDFIIELWQVYQSRCLGADAILLIASILSDEMLKKFQVVAGILGMQCIVEVHDREELERALEADARIIGINNRDLKTFETDLRTTEKLVSQIPHGKAVISESGIKTAEDITLLKGMGVDAVLIGETLMRADSITDKINELKAG